ncbi:hypothetical protein SESBI_36842 [Sesbania bispinosa]|nr:hypothetical protein SESBI_36842 [Sesbania bispinosa]
MDQKEYDDNDGRCRGFDAILDPTQDNLKVGDIFLETWRHQLTDGSVCFIDPKRNSFNLTLAGSSNGAMSITGLSKIFQFYGLFISHRVELIFKRAKTFHMKIFNNLKFEIDYPDLMRRPVVVIDSDSEEESKYNGWNLTLTRAAADKSLHW